MSTKLKEVHQPANMAQETNGNNIYNCVFSESIKDGFECVVWYVSSVSGSYSNIVTRVLKSL